MELGLQQRDDETTRRDGETARAWLQSYRQSRTEQSRTEPSQLPPAPTVRAVAIRVPVVNVTLALL